MALELTRTPIPELTQVDSFKPFDEIAITLSGGGFRASTYSLGCLSYLHRLKYCDKTLLQRVKFLASASGGTMTGILFSAHNQLGIPFEETYRILKDDLLTGDKILKEAARIIMDDRQWPAGSSKNRNTINAFAKAYQQLAFNNMDFGVYWTHANGTLSEICFNASELENGRAFRFQTDGQEETSEILGNMYLRVRNNNSPAIKKLRLGDIMAASSCFPAGFEPIVFPDDFAVDEEHRQQLLDELESANKYDWEDYVPFKRPFALMDGGITDNQGIESLQLAIARRKKVNGRGFDLMLICDVANYFMEPFEIAPEKPTWWNRLSIRAIINAHKYAGVVVLFSAILIFTGHLPYLGWVLGTISAIMFGLFLFARYELLLDEVPQTSKAEGSADSSLGWNVPMSAFLSFFLKSAISKTEVMIKARVSSALRVAMEIYLLQIRRINYDTLYNSPEWAYKTKAVSIYELSKSNEKVLQRQFKRKNLSEDMINLLTPSEALKSVSEYARLMGTTLWFTEDEMSKDKNIRDALIATGQATTCYNLIEYIVQIEEKFPAVKTDADIQGLKTQLLSDWKRFNQDPDFMLQNLQQSA